MPALTLVAEICSAFAIIVVAIDRGQEIDGRINDDRTENLVTGLRMVLYKNGCSLGSMIAASCDSRHSTAEIVGELRP